MRVNCSLAERTFEVVNLEEETCRQHDGDGEEAEQQRSTSEPEDTRAHQSTPEHT